MDTQTGREIEADVAVVGAGGAGLSLVTALDARFGAGPGGPLRVAIVDPVHRRDADRTWCFWDGGRSPLDPLLHRGWTDLELVAHDGTRRRIDVSPMRYVMLRSQDFYAAADAAAVRLGAVRVRAAAGSVEDGPTHALVRAGGTTIRARWVFDSRPAPPARPARTRLVQHFRGWTLRLPPGLLDPAAATLMDFTPPQPARGVAFVYVLPLDGRRALVEYTEFAPRGLPGEAYEAALDGYLRSRWGLTRADVEVEAVEQGAIPMTDAVHARRVGGRIFRLGTAGGATRPSTGYTFTAMQRQAAAVADLLAAGREPLPPRPYPLRHRWADAVLLRALDGGLVDGPDLFVRLFARNPPQRVLRFLDGAGTLPAELSLMSTAPQLPMVRAAVADAGARLRRRVTGNDTH